uniref:Aminopeptidase n=1 Tax=Saccoglossus kowalevskii TaxID=10224 RepID=A0ABM0MMC2_SACKO|nr:PREDICTED: aminopeptidase N-like [Saccoglossus kowalevskii]
MLREMEMEREDDKKSGVYIGNMGIFCIVIAVVALCIGVGLLAYYVPDRNCADSSLPTPEAGTGTDEPPSTKPPGVEPNWPGRVQTNVVPQHYFVHLKVYLDDEDGEKKFKFDGDSYAEFNFTEPTSVVKIHINKLDKIMDEGNIRLTKNGEEVAIKSPREETEYQFLVIETVDDMEKDTVYRLTTKFVGALEDDLAGFYRSSYTTSQNEMRWLATTQFQATDARKAFPCFDEPALKATFDITLEHRTKRTAMSNMPIKNQVTNGDWNTTTYETTVKMSTYLLAFVVSDLVCEQRPACNNDNCILRVCARDEMKHTMEYALDAGVTIINYFEEYFDIPYPLPKQDMAAVPDFAAGAMENWGLILYRETALLYDPDVSSATNKQRVAVVVSHELAHQWFGNLMSPAWWDDLWLNEGFASYVEYIGVNRHEPDWQMMDQFVNEDLHRVFQLDGLGSSHPIFVPVNKPEEISEIFDTISYSKGASIIRMMNYILGEAVFREGLTLFLKRHSYEAATSNDLWAALTEADVGVGDHDVKQIMDTWTLQMGYPVVTVARTSENTAIAEQKHFLIDPDAVVDDKYGDMGYKWYVQLSYMVKDGGIQEIMMSPDDATVDISLPSGTETNDWILANINQTGYYRVNYDTGNWVALQKQLSEDHQVIPVVNRAGLIDDAFNLARSGDLYQTIAFELTLYLIKEEQYLPWDTFINIIIYIRDMLSRTGAFGALELRYQQVYQQTSLKTVRFHRANVLSTACRYGYKPCIDEAVQQFDLWMQDPVANAITPNLKSLVYCNGIRHGGVKEWDFMWERYQQESDAGEKSRLQSSMACSNVPWILSRYLEYSIDSTKIRKQDASYTIRYVASNYVGRALAWDFFRANYDILFDMFGTSLFTWSRMLTALTSQLNTRFELSQLIDFGDNHPNLGSAARAYEQAIESTKANIKWMDNNFEQVQEWLENQ